MEVEGYVRGFARRRPDVAVCVLRFANILGPRPDSPLADYLSLPVLPTVFGYDPGSSSCTRTTSSTYWGSRQVSRGAGR
ncbi:hypothetical protein Smic_33650 [Streptomyces microflavus]|uniref:Uncharacterized protein n=1 Tax=Streptomyces microflavus TaxID=1919 RepID=A0A7J0CQX6_STRMI|nr:hypothetical protein Smic_33650 [Streptomyces microflavus]